MPDAPVRNDEAERTLGRWVAVALPGATLVGAIAAGALSSVGSALLVIAAGAMLGAIALIWASLRTLSGDAPVAGEFGAGVRPVGSISELDERKTRVLRALKDLEGEHALGKIDDDDYEALAATYRQQAKEILKELDAQIAPSRKKAERIAEEYLAKRRGRNGAAAGARPPTDGAERTPSRAASRVACTKCRTSNEADAQFCKKCGTPLADAVPVSDAEY